MKSAMLTAVVLAVALSANAAYVFDDFESYADSAALNAAWVVHSGGSAIVQTLETEDGNQVMKMVFPTGSPQWAQSRYDLPGAVWQDHGVNLTYQGFTGISMDIKVTEVLGQNYFLMIDCWGTTILKANMSSGMTPKTEGWVNWSFDFADYLYAGHNLENVHRFVIGSGSMWNSSTPGDLWVDNMVLIPEPASLSILGLGCVALLKRRMRA